MDARNDKHDFTTTQSTAPALPTELWLQILEQADAYDLWESVRPTSRAFKDHVERIFVSMHLPELSNSLALPRRDPITGALKWPGEAIPQTQIVFSFDKLAANPQYAVLKSPESLGRGGDVKSVDELYRIGVLPKERLQEAPQWVKLGRNHMTGFSTAAVGRFDWDEERKIWTWGVNWRKLLTQFYHAKGEARLKRVSRLDRSA
ncbi:hypothetical protein PTNB73_04177 [Pyrenophora teres f. teres]|nr:hypothetical protein HRS9122_06371 [Pyrenophora teres f. teres]KAE8869124.1 hypothetical protein PTNB73_04177 [Pyrenophora teres f. teres]